MIKSPIIYRVLSIPGDAGCLPSTVLTMGWVRSCCSHLQVGSMPGQPLWLRKTKVQHAPSLPFAYGFFQVIWQISQYVKWYVLRLFLTQKSPKKMGAETLPEANQGTFFDKTKIRRSKISRNSWPLAVRCCSFRGARCCGFFHRTTGGPWCSKFLRPALTLAMKKSRMLYRLKFWQWMRENEKRLFGNLSVAGLAKNWKLRVRIYPCTIHRHCFCPIFPPENCRSHLDNSRVCLTSWERELVHLHPKCWWMSTAMTRPILLKLFRVKDFTHTWDLNATKTAGMAGTLLQGQRPWSLGILRFWTTKSLEKLLGDSSTEAWKLLFNETLVEIPLEPWK